MRRLMPAPDHDNPEVWHTWTTCTCGHSAFCHNTLPDMRCRVEDCDCENMTAVKEDTD